MSNNETMKTKRYAIMSGGDWIDASCEHLLIPESIDVEKENLAHEEWYRNVYVPELRADKKPEYLTFTDWLKNKGATTDEEVIEFFET